MNKEKVIEFLEEQRKAKLIGNNPSSQSDFHKWQLEQAKKFQEVIDWVKALKVPTAQYTFLAQEYDGAPSFIPSNEFLLSVKSHSYEDAVQKVKDKLPQDKRKLTLTLREIEVD